MKTLVFYDSLGGNTEQVAHAICDTVSSQWGKATMVKVDKDAPANFLDCDLIMIGSPVIDWLPTKKLMQCVMETMRSENKAGRIRPSSPFLPGRSACASAPSAARA